MSVDVAASGVDSVELKFQIAPGLGTSPMVQKRVKRILWKAQLAKSIGGLIQFKGILKKILLKEGRLHKYYLRSQACIGAHHVNAQMCR
jgi:hypothetical protein